MSGEAVLGLVILGYFSPGYVRLVHVRPGCNTLYHFSHVKPG